MYQSHRHTNVPGMSNSTRDSYISGTFTYDLNSVITHEPLLSWAGESKTLNTCSTRVDEAVSAKDFLARLESAGNWVSAVF